MLLIFAVRPPGNPRTTTRRFRGATWPEIAAEVRVDPAMADEIERSLHLRLPPR
jgi:hypothetical protein